MNTSTSSTSFDKAQDRPLTTSKLSASQKGFSPLFIILGIILVIGIAGGAYFFGRSSIKPQAPNSAITSQTPQSTVATLDSAKQYITEFQNQLQVNAPITQLLESQWVGPDGNYINGSFTGFAFSITKERYAGSGLYKEFPKIKNTDPAMGPPGVLISDPETVKQTINELKTKSDSYFLSQGFIVNVANSNEKIEGSKWYVINRAYEKNGIFCESFLDRDSFTYASFWCAIAAPAATPIPPPNLSTNNWKVYTNSQFSFKLIYPAKGVSESGQPVECGKQIKEETENGNSGPGYINTILVDNFFAIRIYNWDKPIAEYIKENGENLGGPTYYTKSITDSNADEGLIIQGVKHEGTTGGPPFLSGISPIFRKNNRIFLFSSLQNPGNIGGCLSDKNWNVAESVKFF